MDRALSLPSLRDDLRLLGTGAERDDSPGWTFLDPARKRFFRIGWLEFEPATLALIGIAGLIGLALAARQWDAFTASLAATFTPAGVFGFRCALAIAKSLHELGHAYVATRAGVRVAHMGVAFVVMWPMLYTDTGETWNLADARTRFAIASIGRSPSWRLPPSRPWGGASRPTAPCAARCGVGADPREWFVEGSRLLSVIEPVGCWHASRPPQVTAVQKKPRWRATFPGQLSDQRRRPRANEKPTMPRPTVNSAIVAGSGTG